MGTIIVTVIILAGVFAAFMWTRSGNRKVGGSCSKQGAGCAGCTDAGCPLSKAVETENKYDELATFKRKYDAVFFDLDGTLLNTAGDLTAALDHVLEINGYAPVTEEEVIPVLGDGVINLLMTFLPDDISEDDFVNCYEEFTAFYNENAMNRTYAYEEMRPLLERLKESGYRIAVITNKNDDIANVLVNEFFPGLSDFTLGRTESMNRKPAPDMMEYVMERLGLSASQVMYVGDSEVDYKFASAAGTGCILVSWGFRSRESLPGSAPVVDRPRDILTAVS